jgi:hypothetical protein
MLSYANRDLKINRCYPDRSTFRLAFVGACENGHLDVLQWLHEMKNQTGYSEENIIKNFRSLFTHACCRGDLEVAKFLYIIADPKIDISKWDDEVFRHTCKNGHLEVAQYETIY